MLTSRALEKFIIDNNATNLEHESEIFDVTSSAPLPICDVLIISDLLYYTELAEAIARRVVEALKYDAYILVTGRKNMD